MSSFEMLKVEGSLRVEVYTRCAALSRASSFGVVAWSGHCCDGENGHLPYIDSADGELEITPLRVPHRQRTEPERTDSICFDVLKIADVLYSIG
jgi:hypothetical protein